MRRGALLLLVAVSACRSEPAEAPKAGDAALESGPFYDPELRMQLDLGPAWRRTAPSGESRLVAERRPSGARSYLVAPRLSVAVRTADPADELEVVLGRLLAETRAALPATAATVQRTTTSRWMVGGVPVAGFELAYSVRDDKRDAAVPVVQRTVLALRARPELGPALLEISATWVDEGDEALASEVDAMLRSLSFLAN